mmetsp:Transcript_7598/g.14107  ORF Transcript_7598/g.14107 Transcript_7598/m.14107 type:complete len:248 (+) Transcript_7598:255-998(+)
MRQSKMVDDINDTKRSRSTPWLSARAAASARASIAAAMRKFPPSFTVFAAPGSSPKSCTPLAVFSSMGTACVLAHAGPLTGMVASPRRIPSGRAKTGALTKPMPNAACFVSNKRVVLGATVEQEMCTGAVCDERAGSNSSATICRTASFGSAVRTTEARCATSWTLAAAETDACFAATSASAVESRSKATIVAPAFAKLPTIPLPIFPKPINPRALPCNFRGRPKALCKRPVPWKPTSHPRNAAKHV